MWNSSYVICAVGLAHLSSTGTEKCNHGFLSICNLTKPLLLKFYILFPLGKVLLSVICSQFLKTGFHSRWECFETPEYLNCVSEQLYCVKSFLTSLLSQCLCPHHRGPGSCLRVRTVGSLLCLRLLSGTIWEHGSDQLQSDECHLRVRVTRQSKITCFF